MGESSLPTSHRLCPAKKKHFPCLSLLVGWISSWLLQNHYSLRQKHQPSLKGRVTQAWVAGFCPNPNTAGMGVVDSHGDGSKETSVGSGTLCTGQRKSWQEVLSG